MLQPTLASCSSGVQDDLKQIADWAQIFTQPAHLLERAGKNWLVYHFQLHHDMKAIANDWNTEDYFHSGVASADFVTKLLTAGLPTGAVAEFVAGFLYRFVGDNNLTEVKECWTGGE